MPFALPGQTILTRGGRRVVSTSFETAPDGYSEFLEHITGLATEGSLEWSGEYPAIVGRYTTQAGEVGGLLYATVWKGSGRGAVASACRIVQHGLPSEEVFNEQVENSRVVFVRIESGVPKRLFEAYTRNGYTSMSFTASTNAPTFNCPEILYWSDDAAWRISPQLGTEPELYVW